MCGNRYQNSPATRITQIARTWQNPVKDQLRHGGRQRFVRPSSLHSPSARPPGSRRHGTGGGDLLEPAR
jgi:hypothetical protein